ncbi:unnamed protein product [Hydatigera taeniaeformis]|uniref:Secreted protein n=1 Tax=Hydatigena taeniaeformis TaxID=6205 RepID=A0A0R3WYP4_HYDTA|nr:unnamed protein product [Hydatigera taeniaeformis]
MTGRLLFRIAHRQTISLHPCLAPSHLLATSPPCLLTFSLTTSFSPLSHCQHCVPCRDVNLPSPLYNATLVTTLSPFPYTLRPRPCPSLSHSTLLVGLALAFHASLWSTEPLCENALSATLLLARECVCVRERQRFLTVDGGDCDCVTVHQHYQTIWKPAHRDIHLDAHIHTRAHLTVCILLPPRSRIFFLFVRHHQTGDVVAIATSYDVPRLVQPPPTPPLSFMCNRQHPTARVYVCLVVPTKAMTTVLPIRWHCSNCCVCCV